MAPTSHVLIGLAIILQLYGCGAIHTTENNLITTLLNGLDPSARPVKNMSDPVVVKLGLVLQQIINLNERQQELFIKVWMRYQWKDESLQWNASDYDGISNVRIYPVRIWRPDITLYDDMEQDPNDDAQKVFPATVYSDGTVHWNIPKIISSNCDVDVKFYPWDEQHCRLKFGSWTYDASKVDLYNASATGDMTYYTASGEWNVMSFAVERNVILYNCCPYPYPDVTFIIHIRRKPMYYVFNLILPAVFLTATTVLVFYLPPESGEKVSLGVTVLLALTVFLLMVAEAVPKSETVPLIGTYFETTIILMALSSAMTVICLNIHHRGLFNNEVPYWIRKVVLDWMARPLCLRSKVRGNLSEREPTEVANRNQVTENGIQNFEDEGEGEKKHRIKSSMTDTETALYGILGVLNRFEKNQNSKENEEQCRTDWMLVAMVLDRFLLYLFLILNITVSATILASHPYYTETPLA